MSTTLPIPAEVLRIAETLEGAGHETWCVGGAVRDNLLGLENKDFDLATAATPKQVQKLFRRTVPIGIDHGTVAVIDRGGRLHEVTTFRKDVQTDGRHAIVEFGVSLDEDLARRDFTINAIAYHPIRKEWRDLFGGEPDLSGKVIRAVGDPSQRFREDYLRILRALRFAARFGFEIEKATWEAAVANVQGLKHLSAERVRDEWMKGLEAAEKAGRLVELWRDVGALARWLPEVGSGEWGVGSRESIGTRESGVVADLPKQDAVLITSYLSSDPAATLARLKCSRAEIERGRRVGEFRGQEPDPSSGVDVRRWMAKVGEAVDDLVAIAVAEGSGAELDEAVEAVRNSAAPLTIGDLAVDGVDLMGIGVAQGPALGQMLSDLLDEVLVDPRANTKPRLLERAAAMIPPA
ncbi:MAG: CCA tRNA nucleotidyltransferase [Gemmatimonadetes bacterium]|nr:CCA tRNA nucleotidyltransferase [Gemmatimonadota bacterium]